MKEFIIGADAGGTKTRACAYRADGEKPLREAVTGPGNLAADYPAASDEITAAVRELLAALPGKCAFLAVGAAGISASRDGVPVRELLKRDLCALHGLENTPMKLIPDAELALHANFAPSDNTASAIVISGTGSAAFAFAGDEILRTGGWGHLLGDGGSGYHVSLLFLRKLTAYADTDPVMLRRVLHLLEDNGCTIFTGQDFRAAIVNLVYRQPKSDAASLAPYVAALAETWMPAREILEESAAALTEDVLHLFARIPAETKRLAYTGGFLTHCTLFREIFLETLHRKLPDITVTPSADPASGVVRLYTRFQEEL